MTGSARGLFRATGKRPKKVAVRDLITGEITKQHGGLKREKDEFYATLPEPTRAFLHAEGDRLRRDDPLVWEAAAGIDAMARELEQAGLTVFRSDLVDRGCGAEIKDFFTYTSETKPARKLVTNPPFNRVNWRDGRAKWCFHALEELELEYMALLLPQMWPGAAGLGKFWNVHPPNRIYLMRWRIDFTNQGGAPAFHCWYVWDRTAPVYPGPLYLTLDKGMDGRQTGLFTA